MKTRPKVERAVRLVDARIDAITADFTDSVNAAVMQAQARTIVRLQQSLFFEGGNVVQSPDNRRVLQGVADVFMAELRTAGFERAVLELVHSMPGLVPYFQTVLNAIFETLRMPPPRITFTPEDMELASQVAVQTRADIVQSVAALARQARGKALFSFAAVTPSDLAVFLVKYTGQSVAQASALASTGLATYYRTIADLGYQKVEKEYGELKYVYMGPDDILTRVWCHAMLERTQKRPLTRAEINQYPNGQLPDPIRTGGGWNCRHQFVMHP